MHRPPRFAFAAVLFIGCVSTAATPVEILKEMPARGSLRHGDVIYVDDGTCPVGEVKKITAGRQQAGAARLVECVKKPDNR